jgi:dipeptidyl aminopeptidase/acylaminoacyl peptidase
MKSNQLLYRSPAIALFLLATPAFLGAQVTGKKALEHEDYDIWKNISGRALADNGEWIAFVVSPREGDGVMTIRSIGDRTARIVELDRASGPQITGDSRFLIFTIDPMHAVVDSLEREGTSRDEVPKDSLGVVDLSSAFSGGSFDDGFFRAERIQSWKIPAEDGSYLAYLLEPEEEEADSTAEGEEPEEERPARGRRGGRPGTGQEGEEEDQEKAEGDELVFRDLRSGEETRFQDVTAYFFTEDGNWLVYSASNEDGTADGVFAVRTSSGEASPLLTGEGEYSAVTLADNGDQVAFLSNRDDWEADEPAFTVYHATLGDDEARPVATEGTPGIPEGWWVSDNRLSGRPGGGALSFSENGSRLFFATAPRPEPEDEEEEEIPEDEQVVVDIWNWKDPLIQPMQKVQAESRRNQNFLAYATTEDFRVVQLGTETIPVVTVGMEGNGPLALGMTDQYVKYGWYVSHDGSYKDVFLMDMATGEAEMIREFDGNRYWTLSPAGRYVSWFDGVEKAWMIMDVATKEVRNVSEDIPVPVHYEADDQPDEPPPYGGEWLANDQGFLINDLYDIWQVDPSGLVAPTSLTEGVGRENNTRFCLYDLEEGRGRNGGLRSCGGAGGPEGVDPTGDILLLAFNHGTKASGIYSDSFDRRREPRELVMDDVRFGNPVKADDADVVLLTRSTFREFGDLWLTDSSFEDMEKISYANPQQEDYSWGDAELIEWVSNDGIPIQGILIKPEGFDPSRKYPMMVYFYERSSDGLHNYRNPSAGGSVNSSFYVSRGYVFFIPDIPYEIGHPGESAIDAVVPGVLKIVDQGYVDKDRIGAQGHSWGGYQLAYMVTRSNLFAAVEAGAPVSNMTSAYGGIRWQSGMNRAFQYEHTQSRIGGSLWEETLRYINNSPLFEADKVNTPLLMLHNDEDGAVPWYQGIEFFMALRRLQKPVWLINYNGEPHGVRKPQNQKDWTIRMQQFFDHYLKDAPPPVWMVEGVPAVLKGKTLGLELVREGGNP